MTSRPKLFALWATTWVVLAALSPAAAGLAAAGNGGGAGNAGVETEPATNVTDTAATLNGNLTDLGGADDATVAFTYWREGDRANASTTAGAERSAPGAFDASVSGLAPNTTYVYVARANVSGGGDATGAALAFETDEPTSADDLSIGVQTGGGFVTIAVANASGPVNATVAVTADASYAGEGTYETGDGGAVSLSWPNETVTLAITAEADGMVAETTVRLTGRRGGSPSSAPFGQYVAAFAHAVGGNGMLSVGGTIADIVHARKDVGSSQRGPPDKAAIGPPANRGPPDHAASGDDGNESAGPPARAGLDGNETRGPPGKATKNDERGPPGHAGKNASTSDDGGPSKAVGKNDRGDDGEHGSAENARTKNENDERGPPEHAGGNGNDGSDDGPSNGTNHEDDEDDEDDGGGTNGNNGNGGGNGNGRGP